MRDYESIKRDELSKIADDPDPFVVAVKGLQSVEELLDIAISESLHDPHVLEITQLGFALKVDLAAAMGLIGDRPTFLGLNRFRNRFAHKRTATFSIQDATDYFNSWGPVIRHYAGRTEVKPDEEPVTVLQEAVLVLAVLLAHRITELRDSKAHRQVTHEIVQQIRRGSSILDALSGEKVEDFIQRRLDEARAERQQRGLL